MFRGQPDIIWAVNRRGTPWRCGDNTINYLVQYGDILGPPHGIKQITMFNRENVECLDSSFTTTTTIKRRWRKAIVSAVVTVDGLRLNTLSYLQSVDLSRLMTTFMSDPPRTADSQGINYCSNCRPLNMIACATQNLKMNLHNVQ
ncbi:hypothetical protein J6590_083581 [Homalodisca vitripennis]|nr:hypothetical protein J6590_083581 [Homalodisca vitripennis]